MIRVTEVLDYFAEPELVNWKVKVGAKEAKRVSSVALKLGSKVHKYIEDVLGGKDAKFSRAKDSFELNNCLRAFEKFRANYDLQTEDMEKEVKSEYLGVVGHYDWFGWVGGRPTLIDWKSSARINKKYWVQVHMYAYLRGVALGHLDVGICRLDKNIGEYEFEVMKYDEGFVEVFKSMLMAYRYMKGDAQWVK